MTRAPRHSDPPHDPVPVTLKHHPLVRWSHWINVPLLLGLIASGLSIYWAAPVFMHARDPVTGSREYLQTLGLWLATLNVKYRDFRYVVPFIAQFGLYISPVGFSSSVVPGKWRLLYSLNPMVGVIDGFRWAILGGDLQLYWPGFLLSSALTIAIFFLAVRYFRSTERKFADII